MENYEIRIVKKGHHPVILAGPYTSDFAAVRRAQSLADKDDEVEVWRDVNCLYSTRPGEAGSP
jgi:hypothetical protein